MTDSERLNGACWSGDEDAHLWDYCCNEDAFGPGGNPLCWQGETAAGLSFSRCCDTHRNGPPTASSSSWSRGGSRAHDDIGGQYKRPLFGGGGPLEVSTACWRQGFSFSHCCSRSWPRGDTTCWVGKHSYEKCCLPPSPFPSGLLFEDVDCMNDGADWSLLLKEVSALTKATDFGRLRDEAAEYGGSASWARRLARMLRTAGTGAAHAAGYAANGGGGGGSAPRAWCHLGALATRLALLLLCLADSTFSGKNRCSVAFGGAAAALRDSLGRRSVVQWASTAWPVLSLFRHISIISSEEDPACALPLGGVDWPSFHLLVTAGDDYHKIMSMASSASEPVIWQVAEEELPGVNPCEAGRQWIATLKMHMCASTEALCFRSHALTVESSAREAAEAGSSLRRWLGRAGDWDVFGHMMESLEPVMRHRYTLGLTRAELRLLGIVAPLDMPRCLDLPEGEDSFRQLLQADAGVTSIIEVAIPGRTLEQCRANCGSMQDLSGHGWHYFGLLRPELSREHCFCGGQDLAVRFGSCNTTASNMAARAGSVRRLEVHRMPMLLPSLRLLWLLTTSAETGEPPTLARSEHPVLSQAASSLAGLDAKAPVFVTMVFGHMARYLSRFSARVHRLGIPNVVVFVLDEQADEECNRAAVVNGQRVLTCLRGEGRTALQKYTICLVYLVLGRDVFWFDFDSVWLKNPLPLLRQAWLEAVDALESGESPLAMAAIDFDSTDCVMNAFFFLTAERRVVRWLISLLHWLYERPFVHDQAAFGIFLGIGPLVDEEPIPGPLPWAALDPNVFTNAARFEGLGFSSSAKDIAFFHFFDGWNSNMPGDSVAMFVKPVYADIPDLFEALYDGDEGTVASLLERSRFPAPSKLRSCRHMADNALGVSMDAYTIAV